MNVGSQFRSAFRLMFDQMKEKVEVHRNEKVEEHLAMKNNEKGKRDNVFFSFIDPIEIKEGDKIKQPASSRFWVVREVEDQVVAGEFHSQKVWVDKEGKVKNAPKLHENTVHIHGPNYGAVSVSSPGSNQHVSVNFTAIQNDIEQLRRLLADSDIDELDKEEASTSLTRIEELSKREKSGKVAEKVKIHLEIVKSVFSIAKDAALVAAPYINNIAGLLS